VIELAIISLGLVFVMIGTLGILRFRDIYSRLQASGVSDNAGIGLILLALVIEHGFDRFGLPLLILLFLILLTNPIVTHSIAKSAFTQRYGGPGGSR
jgi:multicomponent Na+:H+ antiporter subunit G